MDTEEKTLLEIVIPHQVELHYKRPLYDSMYKVTSSRKLVTFLRKSIDSRKIDHKEFFWVILLNAENHILGLSEISVGTTNAVTVNIKEIFQLAILSNATAIIICHNHPSGNLGLSEQDKKITKKVKASAQFLDIGLLDHIIITSESYFSFADAWEL